MLRKKKQLNKEQENIWIHLFFVLVSLTYIIPFIYVISISLSSEKSIAQYGYCLFPKVFDFKAYEMIAANPTQLIDSYKVTVLSSVIGTIIGVFMMAIVAYTISRQDFKWRKQVTFYIYFTMLFGGGLIPTYVLCTQYLHIGNSFMIYMATGLLNAWYIIIIKTFFQGLPDSLVESAKLDGASEFKTFFFIILPLSKPVIATISLFTVLNRWNDWYTSLIYIQNPKLYSLQYMLQRIIREAEYVKTMASSGVNITSGMKDAPTETMRFAMAIIAAGPMLVVFPFFQKYFTRGLTVGAIKG